MTHTPTPGPWTDEDYEITAEDGSVICSVKTLDDFPCIDEDNDETGMAQLKAEFEANARLIAAAPDLYEACKATLIDLRVWRLLTERGCEDAIARLEAAVAKAEGRDIKEEG